MNTPLNTWLKKIAQDATSRVLIEAECAELGIWFTCEPKFGFVSDRYPDTPFESLAALLMVERVQSWFGPGIDYDEAEALLLLVYLVPLEHMEVLYRRDEFDKLMASTLLSIAIELGTRPKNDPFNL